MLSAREFADEIQRVGECHPFLAKTLSDALMPWLESQSMYHGSGERITRKDLNLAYRMGQENGRLFTALVDATALKPGWLERDTKRARARVDAWDRRQSGTKTEQEQSTRP